MSVDFRVLTGSRAGHRERFTKPVIAIGRHPLCDFQFDPHQDLDVSTRHAEIRAVGDGYVLVDIGSTNGTYVNGVRIARERRLESGDEISFGEFGPKVRVEIPNESGKQRLAPLGGSAALGEAAPNGAWGKGAEAGVSAEPAPPATRSVVTEARPGAGAETATRQRGHGRSCSPAHWSSVRSSSRRAAPTGSDTAMPARWTPSSFA